MAKKFHMLNLPRMDSANAFIQALLSAGYERTENDQEADFFLHDIEPMTKDIGKWDRWMRAVKGKPVFVYPHTPYAFYLWDGLMDGDVYIPWHSTACNFVVTDKIAHAMRAYGYPCKVEAVGFTRCDVKTFRPTHGRDLLYASARLLQYPPRWPYGADRAWHYRAMEWIVKNRDCFNRVVINYSNFKGWGSSKKLFCILLHPFIDDLPNGIRYVTEFSAADAVENIILLILWKAD
jgi:hypothetical protein